MEINELQHPNSVWTWKSSPRRGKASLWLPYFSKVTKLKGDRYTFEYNGGDVTAHLKEIDFIMFYGASGDLPVKFLDALNTYKIPLVIHRRNLSDPYLPIYPDLPYRPPRYLNGTNPPPSKSSQSCVHR